MTRIAAAKQPQPSSGTSAPLSPDGRRVRKFIPFALGTVVRAKGMTEVARKTGLSRESLYKALSAEGNPEFGTILKVMKALDLKITATTA